MPRTTHEPMTAAQLVYRLVTQAIDGDRPHDDLCDLAGTLYDAAAHAFDSVTKYRTSAPEIAAEFRRNREELVDLAGYVLRVAGTYEGWNDCCKSRGLHRLGCSKRAA